MLEIRIATTAESGAVLRFRSSVYVEERGRDQAAAHHAHRRLVLQPFLDQIPATVMRVGERTRICPAWRGGEPFAEAG